MAGIFHWASIFKTFKPKHKPANSQAELLSQNVMAQQETPKPDIAVVPAKQINLAMIMSKKQFPFMDLPLELRYRVYEMALTHPYKNIDIVMKHSVGSRIRIRKVYPYQSIDIVRKYGIDSTIGIRKTACRKEQNELVHKHFRLLEVSRQINAEASFILYGGNQFSFYSLEAFKHFLVDIGDARHHLRYLKVQGKYARRHVELAFALLTQSKQIRCIILESMTGLDHQSARGLFSVLKPFLVSVARERHSVTAGYDLIKWWKPTTRGSLREWSKEDQSELRKCLEDYFYEWRMTDDSEQSYPSGI